MNSRRGFTLVELMVVILILGTLAAIVIPQFSNAAGETRTNAAKMDLNRIRTQIDLYGHQHHGTFPAPEELVAQLTHASNSHGAIAAPGTPGYPLGPYVMEMPRNPFTDSNDVSSGAPGTSAWYFDQETGELRHNHTTEAREW